MTPDAARALEARVHDLRRERDAARHEAAALREENERLTCDNASLTTRLATAAAPPDPSQEDSHSRLRDFGWETREYRQGARWMVTCAKGPRTCRAEGETREEAWADA